MQQITDLDERDRKAILDEIEQNQELVGNTGEKRSECPQTGQVMERWPVRWWPLPPLFFACSLRTPFFYLRRCSSALTRRSCFICCTDRLCSSFWVSQNATRALTLPSRSSRLESDSFSETIGVHFVFAQLACPRDSAGSLAACAGFLLVFSQHGGRARSMDCDGDGDVDRFLRLRPDHFADTPAGSCQNRERYSALIVANITSSGRSTTYYLRSGSVGAHPR